MNYNAPPARDDHTDSHTSAEPCGTTSAFDEPNAARVWNWLAGGSLNTSLDRELATRLAAVFPAHPLTRAGWDFQHRVVTELLGRGIRQFLDLGSGLPSHRSVHDIVETARVTGSTVYVDIDPVVVHATAIRLANVPRTAAVRADIRNPTALLTHPDLQAVLNLDQPVAVLAFGVLDTIADADHPGDHVTALADAFSPGSYLAISHLTNETTDPSLPAQLDTVIDLFAETGTTLVPRDAATVASWLRELDVLDPGVCQAAHWRPDHPVHPGPHQQLLLGAVARTPHPAFNSATSLPRSRSFRCD